MSPNDLNAVSDDEPPISIENGEPATTHAAVAAVADSAEFELKATPEMCYHCFDVLLEKLKNNSSTSMLSRNLKNFRQSSSIATASSISGRSTPVYAERFPSEESLECPLFITWEKRKQPNSPRHNNNDNYDHHYELRGCIGTLVPKPILSSIGEYALLSALRDKRFRPVELDELPLLRVGVSLLVQYEDCDHCHDWVVGVHGIIIKFYASDAVWNSNTGHDRGERLSATFLPEVAAQQGWDQTKTVQSLIRKAGFRGTITPTLIQRIRCTRYQSSKCKISFEDYVQNHPNGAAFVDGKFNLLSDDSNADHTTGSQSNCHLM